MDANFLSPNAMLIQGATMSDLESMMSRILDKKLANIIESTPKVEDCSRDGLYKRKDTAIRLQISLPTLDAWTKAGIINGRRIGTRIYYTEKDIDDALKKACK